MTHQKYYIEIAEQIISYGNKTFDGYEKAHPYLIGAYNGLAGNLYFNSKLYVYTKKELYKSYCIKMMAFINNILPEDRMLDMISGSAGYLHVLCSLYPNISDTDLKNVTQMSMRLASDHLISKYHKKEFGWKLRIEGNEKMYSGFSHGDSGIMAALARCDFVLNERMHKKMIEDVVENHRKCFLKEGEGWFRDEDHDMIVQGWCHGTTGILASRLLLKSYGYKNVDGDIETAMQLLVEKSFGHNATLCHGDLGHLEIMRLAGYMLNDKEILEKERDSFRWLSENVLFKRYEGNCFRGSEVLGMMIGLSGYVYSLVKHEDKRIPSILYLE